MMFFVLQKTMIIHDFRRTSAILTFFKCREPPYLAGYTYCTAARKENKPHRKKKR